MATSSEPRGLDPRRPARPAAPWIGPADAALVTDLYELTMASAYDAAGIDHRATFDLFVRRLPEERRFLVACGLEPCIESLEAARFDDAALSYLASLERFPAPFLDRLRGWRFRGDVDAVPEGEVVFAGEPILRVSGPLFDVQIVETLLLTTIASQTLVASKAARVAIAAGGRPFFDYSARRDHGAGAALGAARAAFVGGAAGTSLVLAGQRYGIPLSGTMAHSFVMTFGDEAEAFRCYARQDPHGATLLIDTYDTVEGARTAARVASELAAEGVRVRAVRLDSGDLGDLSVAVRGILDAAGHDDIRIYASGDLDEHVIAALLAAGAPIDAFGVGTQLGTSADAPALGAVYKLVEDDTGPKVKLAPGKVTLPGRKQVHRYADHELLALDGEQVPEGGRALLEPVLRGGVRVRGPEPLELLQQRCRAAVAALPDALRSLAPAGEGESWEVRTSPGVDALLAAARALHGA